MRSVLRITCGAVQRLCELSRSRLINFTVEFQRRLGDDSILKSTQAEILQLRNRQKCLEETIVLKQAEVGIHSFFSYRNVFYKNIEAEICEILRIF